MPEVIERRSKQELVGESLGLFLKIVNGEHLSENDLLEFLTLERGGSKLHELLEQLIRLRSRILQARLQGVLDRALTRVEEIIEGSSDEELVLRAVRLVSEISSKIRVQSASLSITYEADENSVASYIQRKLRDGDE
ncbi:MAG: hypothetical protein ABIK73_06975 [candidate division WOR-3 bacterium]